MIRLDNASSQPLTYRPDLDGLRGLAIALVLLGHLNIATKAFVPVALHGVTVFFVLSGYLITSLLMREERIDWRRFYLRRALRLFPALWVMLAVVTVIWGVGAGLVGALTYSTNWLVIIGFDTTPVHHTWSLAIEEQFYLLWPWLLIWLPRRLLVPVALVGAIGMSVAHEVAPFPWSHYATFTNGGALMAGCVVALARVRLPAFAALLGVALIVIGGIFGAHVWIVVGSTLILTTESPVLVPLAALGRRAYSLYLWNSPLYVLWGPLGWLITFPVAELSYRLVERPLIRRYHDRLRPRSGQVDRDVVLLEGTGGQRPVPSDGRELAG